MNNIKILWVDDEIDLLKPHILFLEKKNYTVTTCNNGQDAIDLYKETAFDVVFLDILYHLVVPKVVVFSHHLLPYIKIPPLYHFHKDDPSSSWVLLYQVL